MSQSFGKKSTAEEVLQRVDLTGKTVLLTGCNSGLGFETLRVLTQHNAHVLSTARSLIIAQEACAKVRGKTTPVACDLGDLSSVKQAIEAVRATGRPLNCIIANAGIMMLPQLEVCQGVEKQFAVNYLGHFMLITGLLPAIPKHVDARIVIVSSEAHKHAPKAGVDLDNLSGSRGYNSGAAYGQSNVARILFARALARRLKDAGITANSLHPGVIGSTGLSRHAHPFLQWGINLFSKTIAQGAATQCYLAANPEAAGVTGEYFADCKIAKTSKAAQDDVLGERLWTLSEKLVAQHSG